MTPLRIVLVLLEAPVPFGNAAARWYSVLLRELVARGHRVTTFAVCSKPAEMAEARERFPASRYDLRLFPLPVARGWRAKWKTLRRPFSYFFSDELRQSLDAELARGYDILHLEQLWTGWLALPYAERAILKVHYLFSIDLALSKPHGLRERLIRVLMLRGERRLLRAFPHVATLSERLREGIRHISPRTDVRLMPCGIDARLYAYIPDERRTAKPVVGLIGSMGWHPSRSAAERFLSKLWPEIKSRVPDATALVVGWGAREALRAHLPMPDVVIEENVPDTRPYFDQLGVLLYAPDRGSGVKVKVQEALAYGVPVVTTTEGIEGLAVTDGEQVRVADTDAALVECTVRLLNDPAARNRQRAAGRAWLEAACGPTPTVDAVEAIYDSLLRSRGQTR